MSDDLSVMPGTLLPENERCVAPAEHRFAQHPYCVVCDEFHPADGPHESSGHGPRESSGRLRVRLPTGFSVEQTAASEFRHEVKPGCHCLRCTEERLKAANPIMIVNPHGTLEPTVRLTSDQITWFKSMVQLLPEKDRTIVQLRAELEDALRERNVALIAVIKRHAVIAAKDARIAELKSELAAFTIANAAPVVETETPAHNPFRDFPTDHRRMGP